MISPICPRVLEDSSPAKLVIVDCDFLDGNDAGMVFQVDLYSDNISGAVLDPVRDKAARREEVDFVHEFGVYRKPCASAVGWAVRGLFSPCLFLQEQTKLKAWVHGDDMCLEGQRGMA